MLLVWGKLVALLFDAGPGGRRRGAGVAAFGIVGAAGGAAAGAACGAAAVDARRLDGAGRAVAVAVAVAVAAGAAVRRRSAGRSGEDLRERRQRRQTREAQRRQRAGFGQELRQRQRVGQRRRGRRRRHRRLGRAGLGAAAAALRPVLHVGLVQLDAVDDDPPTRHRPDRAPRPRQRYTGGRGGGGQREKEINAR